jgi:hypothetical protein
VSNYVERTVTARKPHQCRWGQCRTIEPGERYIIATEYPGGDTAYADTAGHPIRLAICADCAAKAGRPVEAKP